MQHVGIVVDSCTLCNMAESELCVVKVFLVPVLPKLDSCLTVGIENVV